MTEILAPEIENARVQLKFIGRVEGPDFRTGFEVGLGYLGAIFDQRQALDDLLEHPEPEVPTFWGELRQAWRLSRLGPEKIKLAELAEEMRLPEHLQARERFIKKTNIALLHLDALRQRGITQYEHTGMVPIRRSRKVWLRHPDLLPNIGDIIDLSREETGVISQEVHGALVVSGLHHTLINKYRLDEARVPERIAKVLE